VSRRIEIGTDRVDYYNPTGQLTKSLLFHRDAQNRIDAIYDPQSLADAGWDGSATVPVAAVPSVKYMYDSIGNLTTVSNLVSRTGVSPVYQATTYIYSNPNFPHYITEIRDPRGLTPLRSLYDDQGRLYAVVDAFGKTNLFVHDLTGKTETVFDRMGNQTIHIYDDRGNVISSTAATATIYRNNATTDAYGEGKNAFTKMRGAANL
jgi:YD repeat-containing protein